MAPFTGAPLRPSLRFGEGAPVPSPKSLAQLLQTAKLGRVFLRLYKIRVRVKFTLKIFLKSGKVAAHFAVCSKPKSAGVGQVVSRESRPVSQSVGRGSPKGVSGTRATQDRYSLHAKTPPRPLGHRSTKGRGRAGVACGGGAPPVAIAARQARHVAPPAYRHRARP